MVNPLAWKKSQYKSDEVVRREGLAYRDPALETTPECVLAKARGPPQVTTRRAFSRLRESRFAQARRARQG
ncbi:hypothetical protein [Paraburkholderia sp. J41]|uniref:hypothetical protein n=1 Tax=Paraburkholderia sp. J41 TaxID=2805433 RepID=UPI002AC316D0|nr:hypothetical protein [Paraburkholderia sp. J41]